MQSVFISSLKFVLADLIGSIFYFPIWWYTKGFFGVLRWAGNKVKDVQEALGIGVWVVNIFRPMFGERAFSGRLISFFMRVFQIIARSVLLLFFMIGLLFLVCIWLALPVFVVYGIGYQFVGLVGPA